MQSKDCPTPFCENIFSHWHDSQCNEGQYFQKCIASNFTWHLKATLTTYNAIHHLIMLIVVWYVLGRLVLANKGFRNIDQQNFYTFLLAPCFAV